MGIEMTNQNLVVISFNGIITHGNLDKKSCYEPMMYDHVNVCFVCKETFR
jgi:hypothetical protein